LTIAEGAIRPFNRFNAEAWYMKRLAAVAEEHGFSLHVPVKELSDDVVQKVLYGTGKQKYRIHLSGNRYYDSTYEGVIPNLERRHRETDSEFMRKDIERFMRERKCTACKGARLKPVVLAVTVNGLSIMDICNLDVANALDMIGQLEFTAEQQHIVKLVVKEIMARLGFMNNVGLSYLELGRAANTLSGGEAQRIRLATQIGSGLQGVLYVLDEPSIGLHQRDNDRPLQTLKLRIVKRLSQCSGNSPGSCGSRSILGSSLFISSTVQYLAKKVNSCYRSASNRLVTKTTLYISSQ